MEGVMLCFHDEEGLDPPNQTHHHVGYLSIQSLEGGGG